MNMFNEYGIILKTTDYKDKDTLLTVLTVHGVITITAKGVRTMTSKLKSACTVMTLANFSYVDNDGRKVLSGIEMVDNFYEAWRDYDKNSSIMFCLELSEKCFVKEENTVKEFTDLLKAIQEIVYGESEPICSVLKFAISCANSIGVDYTEISEYDSESFMIIEAFSVAEPDEVGTIVCDKEKIKRALILLHNVFKNYFGIKISSLKSVAIG